VPFAVSDAVSQVLASALDGVSLRQQVTANNIANLDTPGFRATSVDFETQLRSAIEDGSFDSGTPVDAGATTTPTDTPVGANGNNVDFRKESMNAIQSQYQYQILTRAVTERFNLVKTAATGQ
jgi:flagellar basal-body rod protein FlgB